MRIQNAPQTQPPHTDVDDLIKILHIDSCLNDARVAIATQFVR